MKTYICKICKKENPVKYYKVPTYCSATCKNNDPEIIARMVASQRETYLKKYGGHPMNSKEVQEKHKKSMLGKYGVEHALQSTDFKKKVKETTKERYGEGSEELVKKCKQSKLKKYGNANYNGQKKRTTKAIDKKIYEWEDIRILDYDYNIPVKTQRFTLQCIRCETIWEGTLTNNYKPKCKFCSDKIRYVKISKGHQELIDFLKTLIPKDEIKVNDRTLLNGHEIDIYIPSRKIAIEFNGIFYHSNLFKEADYHVKKTTRCLVRGVHLIQIFDSQWWAKSDIIKSMLTSKLGVTSSRIPARKCTVRIIPSKEKKDFFNRNHLHGDTNSSINIGLYYNDTLVAATTYSKSRFDKQFDFELVRFASLLNTTVIGGFSKMLAYFIKNYEVTTLVSYCDRTWSTGLGYFRCGFTFGKFTVPNYHYFKNLEVYTRQEFQKAKLPSKLKTFDKSLTEVENMYQNGYLRFWDCGHIKLILNTVNKNIKQ